MIYIIVINFESIRMKQMCAKTDFFYGYILLVLIVKHAKHIYFSNEL